MATFVHPSDHTELLCNCRFDFGFCLFMAVRRGKSGPVTQELLELPAFIQRLAETLADDSVCRRCAVAAVLEILSRRRERPSHVNEHGTALRSDFTTNPIELVLHVEQGGNRHVGLVVQPRAGGPDLMQPPPIPPYPRFPRQEDDDRYAILDFVYNIAIAA